VEIGEFAVFDMDLGDAVHFLPTGEGFGLHRKKDS
jgi:hypothetical protein